jgi:hypothetical protein
MIIKTQSILIISLTSYEYENYDLSNHILVDSSLI